MKLFLVRNAETEWNTEKRLQGHQDSVLTGEGKQQSKRLAELLKNEHFDAAFSSDLGRAIDTAKTILESHAGIELHRKSELRERSHGIVQGMTQREAFKKYPELQKQRLKDKFLFKNPKGESYEDALKRLMPFWEELKEKHAGNNVLIVSHGGITRLLLSLTTNVSHEEVLSIDQPHDCIYVIEDADSNAVVKHLTSQGLLKGALKRVQLKKMPKPEEDEDDIGFDDE
ncbi:histidine phosphatase family protein [Candidatus Micrarchaeota archaeon]|nr:histidine phosphatase family protein [Candidatus Micrarchaeota archaeon]MBU1929970.1 histidine phosphatase family protein [Candidatus Micrarchaeota archaeon]